MAFSKPHIIQLPKISDPRGNLSFIEGMQHIPFEIKRAYWIYDVPGGMHRDGHAFRKQHEVIIAMSGSFDIVLNDGTHEVRHHMARSYYALYVPPMTWRKIDNFSTNSVVLVLSSEYYDPEDYIESFEEYLKISHNNITDNELSQSSRVVNANGAEYDFNSTTVNNCEIIQLVQDSDPIPFDIKRAYYIYDIPGGEERGGHAHRQLRQLIVALSGSFDVVLDDGTHRRSITLNRPYQGLVIVPGIWRVLENFSSGAVCLCIASMQYNEDDYIRPYNDFIKLRNK